MTTTAAFNDAAATCTYIGNMLRERGWYDHKISHFRRPEAREFERGTHHTAIEVGYVTGECTVRLNDIDGQVDQGTTVYMRGIGAAFVKRVEERVAEIEKNIGWVEKGRVTVMVEESERPVRIYEEQM